MNIKLAILSIAMGTSASTAHAQCPLTFDTAVSYDAGSGPNSIAVGDLNGDDRPDLTVLNYGGETVSALLGNGDGTFAAPVNYATVAQCNSLAIGNLNGDGKLDLAVSSKNTILVLLGNGDGTFADAVNYAVPGTSVAIGDFNGDGKSDLVVANSGLGTVSVLLGNGNGAFAAPVNSAAGANATTLTIGDLNTDGKLDLVVTNSSINSVSALLGNGNGTFAAPVSSPSGNNPYHPAIGDLNGDNKLDLAIRDFSSNGVSVLLGNGNGTFAAPVTYAAGTGPYSVAIGDLNGDGKPELVLPNYTSNDVSVLVGNGNGTFSPAASYAVFDLARPEFVAIGDFNADGKPDMATVNNRGDNVSVLLNSGAGFAAPTFTQQPTGRVVQAGASAAFTAAANGFGASLNYQWRRNGMPLSDGGNIAGAATNTLTIDPAQSSDVASYDLQVVSAPSCTGGNQVATSIAIVLAINGTACPADFNGDHQVDDADFVQFLAAYNELLCPE
ncbi:MAG: VCBS repeat-containing protein [Phycisphaeraceae bacterium]|nr:VCBS repeat-containing protein [Phycisphaeraceae bacterium]